MKVIYIAGPHTGKSWADVESNIKTAEAAALQLWAAGWAVICPHLNSAHMEQYDAITGMDYKKWIAGTMEILKRSDAVYFLEGWEKSSGSRAELEEAAALQLSIYYQELDGIPKP